MKRFALIDKLDIGELEIIKNEIYGNYKINLDEYFLKNKSENTDLFDHIWTFLINAFQLNPNPDAFDRYLRDLPYNKTAYKYDKHCCDKARIHSLFEKDQFYYQDILFDTYYTLRYLLLNDKYADLFEIEKEYKLNTTEVLLAESIERCIKQKSKISIPINIRDNFIKEKKFYKLSKFCIKFAYGFFDTYTSQPWYEITGTGRDRFQFDQMFSMITSYDETEYFHLLQKITGTLVAAKIFSLNIKDNKYSNTVFTDFASAILIYPNQYGILHSLTEIIETFNAGAPLIESDLLEISYLLKDSYNRADFYQRYFSLSMSFLYILMKSYLIQNNNKPDNVLLDCSKDLNKYIRNKYYTSDEANIPYNILNDPYFAKVKELFSCKDKDKSRVSNNRDKAFVQLQKDILQRIYHIYSNPELLGYPVLVDKIITDIDTESKLRCRVVRSTK